MQKKENDGYGLARRHAYIHNIMLYLNVTLVFKFPLNSPLTLLEYKVAGRRVAGWVSNGPFTP